jgi:hypothetical protein
MKNINNKKGNMTLVFVFLASSVILIILAGLFSPMLVNFSTIITESGEGILIDAQPSIDNIQDDEIRNQINSSLTGAIQSSADNISILAGFYRYAWVIILIVSGIIIFLFARLLVETGGRGRDSMNKNIIIFALLFLLTLQVAEATSINDTRYYYGMDEQTGTNIIDKVGNLNATAFDSPINWTGIIDFSYNYTGSNMRIISNNNINISGSSSRTISLWTYWNGTGNYRHFAGWGTGATGQLFALATDDTGKLYFAGWGTADYNTGTTIPLNQWVHIAVTYNGSRVNTYVNGTPTAITNQAKTLNTLNGRLFIGSRYDNSSSALFMGGAIDEVAVWDRALNDSEILSIKQAGLDGLQYPFSSPTPPTETNITLTAKNNITNVGLTNFTILLLYNGLNYSFNTTNGTIETGLLLNSSVLYNMTFSSDENGGYYNAEYLNLNLSPLGTYQGALAPYFYLFNVTYSNFSLISGANYTRLLSYEYVYTCPSHITTYRAEYINQTLNTETALTCNNMTNTITRTYSHPIEGAYNITLGLTAPGFEQNTTQRTFISDLYAPVISLFNVTTSEGFNPSGYNITLRCYDNIAPSLYYNLTRNEIIIYNASLSNNTLSTQTLTNLDGTHDNIFMCSDNFTTTTSLLSNTYYFKQMQIINEKTGNLFPISNMTDARIVFESPAYNTTLNLKTLNTSVFNISSNNTAGRNFRLELEYSTGEVVVRDLNTKYVESSSSICANTNPTTHETQFIISATIKPAIIRSNVHNCYVLADTTRFAYQSNFMAKYYTIPTYYFLNSISTSGEESLIASVEGGTGSTINLDTLSFGSTIFNVNLRTPSVMIQKHPTSNNTLIIFYYNPKVDNTALDIEIYYNNSLYFSTTTTTSPNNITINFDYTTLSVSESATFKLVFTATTDEGEENIITTYYSLSGSSGSFPVALGLVLGVMMFISLLTIVSPSFAFGYFGILSTLAGIFIIALSPAVWYSNLFIGVFIIIGIYQFMHFTQTNRTTGGII